MTAVALREAVRSSALELRSWTLRHWLVAVAAAAVVALVTGVPTDMVPTPVFRRMTPVVWWDWPLWLAATLLFGLVAATYLRTERPHRARSGALLGGGLLTVLAVGCPVCNKLVVLALGTAGALTYFAPIQPILGLLSVGLAATALVARTGWPAACRAPETSMPPGVSRIEP